jgi:hypothetical protein
LLAGAGASFLPVESQSQARRRKYCDRIKWTVGAILAGGVVATLGKVCVMQSYLLGIVHLLKEQKLTGYAMLGISLYGLAVIVPLLLFYAWGLFVINSSEMLARVKDHISGLKMISSACFLGLGASLLWMFY